jgi:ribonuclease G
VVAATGPVEDRVETAPAEAAPAEKPKVRRGSKRAPTPAADEPTEEGTTARRRPRRRAAPPVAVPAGSERVLLATSDYGELRVALVEDGRLAEIYIQRPEKPSYLGNIYRSRVENVLRGMDAAFIDFGLEKSGFLHVDEVTVPEEKRRGRRITQLLQPGQEVLVQVTKDPMGSKGARLTTRMSLAGRYLVYVPGGSGVGVSRRLAPGERDRLRDLCKQLKAKDAGLIVRTVAEGKGLEDLRRDLQYLSRLWSRIKAKAEKTPVPGLAHEEIDVALSAVRDLFNESCARYVVDTEKEYKLLTAYVDRVAPELRDRVELYAGERPLFEAYGIEEQIARTLARRVTLPSGGNLVIDHTEALTVIDVNSGKYTGGSGLEDTITLTNLEAAVEVVRQLRLRDIGGIIVIDFIDMERADNRDAVLATLERELATDRTKTYVVEISPLGLVEMTRQNTTDGARGILTRQCPRCVGTARVLSEETMMRAVERELRHRLPTIAGEAVLVEVTAGVAERLGNGDRIRALERATRKHVFFQGSKMLPVETFEILASGTRAQVRAQLIPVTEGEELDVELEHSLTYSPRDALAVVAGYPVIVGGGRSFIGARRHVRVEVALRTGGQATMLGPARSVSGSIDTPGAML